MADSLPDGDGDATSQAALSKDEASNGNSIDQAHSDSTTLSSAPPLDSEVSNSETDGSGSTVRLVDATNTELNHAPHTPPHAPGLIASQTPQPALSAQSPNQTYANDAENIASSGTPSGDATEESAASGQPTMDGFVVPAVPVRGAPRGRPKGRGRGGRGAINGTGTGVDAAHRDHSGTPQPSERGRGRGRGGGRPRGRGRGGVRGGKRQRDENDGEDGSDVSDEVTPIATMTKSGRNIQKPINFVPPPPFPTTRKPKRKYVRRNPESAVCKVCLRGTSPASNPVVFCDGCNAPYHRWCHQPPIDLVVIEQTDKEWYCAACEKGRIVPVEAKEVAGFVSVEAASEEQKKKYFASLPPGVLVTLLVKATTLQPGLPLFHPKFRNDVWLNETPAAGRSLKTASSQSHATRAAPPAQANGTYSTYKPWAPAPAADDAAYTPEVHPENYPRPGRGLMSTLPPEQGEELQCLVDDDDEHGVFAHFYRTYHDAASSGTEEESVQTDA